MRNKKISLINVLKQKCSKKVRICTIKFCAIGCFVYDFDDDNLVCLENVTLLFSEGQGKQEHRESICICDDHIIAFEVIADNS